MPSKSSAASHKVSPSSSGGKSSAVIEEPLASPEAGGIRNPSATGRTVIGEFADGSTAPAFLDPVYGWMTPAGVCLPPDRQPVTWHEAEPTHSN